VRKEGIKILHFRDPAADKSSMNNDSCSRLYAFFINRALFLKHSSDRKKSSQGEEWRIPFAVSFIMAFRRRLNRKETACFFGLLGFLGRSALGIFGLGLLTGAALLLHANLSTVGLLYFLSIVLVALHWGFWQATVLSAVAVLLQCYFFIPPIYSFDIADTQNYVALVVFEFSALLVSRLSAREQSNARDANAQRRSTAMLYELSRRILQLDVHQPPGSQLLQLVKEIFSVDSIAIFDSGLDLIDVSGPFPLDAKEMARNTCYFGMNQDYEDLNLSRRVLRLDANPIGALLIAGNLNPLTVDAIASLVSITFDRYRSFASETKAEAAHQGEQLRTTVLSILGSKAAMIEHPQA
jgi:two-component system, OmpR family, sensor histidine kinase KdpD